jgi:NiFe hydrogenase assembly chaperone HybE-like protein
MSDAATIRRVFEEIHRTTFLLDPASNPRLGIEVLDAGLAYDTPTFVLITPWTLNGLAFPPDDRFPEKLEIAAATHRAYPIEVPALGRHRSVNLVPDVSKLPTFAHARAVAEAMAPAFREAVARARETLAVDPSRRRSLRGRLRTRTAKA